MFESEDPEKAHKDTLKQFAKYGYDDRRLEVIDDGSLEGSGSGFTGTELLSKDELNVILDLEDETERQGQFSRIYPKSNANVYYGFMEERRY